MNPFTTNTPEYRALGSLIHDTNAELSRLRLMTKNLGDWNTKNAKEMHEHGISASVPFVVKEYLITIEQSLAKAIDLYYHRAKNGFFECPVCTAVKGHTKECTYPSQNNK